jgi:hypothetical protein
MARGRRDLVGHTFVSVGDLAGAPPDNIVMKAKTDAGRWIEEATSSIGRWRSIFRSTYIQWSLALNGLHVAAERYRSPEWKNPNRQFYTTSLRVDESGSASPQIIKLWDGKGAADAHLGAVPLMAAWGLIDLYACFEEVVFDLYCIYLRSNPDSVIRGPEFKHLRKLRRDAEGSPQKKAEWEAALAERLATWQRNRIYDGLGRVLIAFFGVSGLKKPETFKSGPEDWASTMDGVALLRNCLVHGEQLVSKDLADFSSQPNAMTFDFKEGMPLEVTLLHLQGVELFSDQLLSALNLALLAHPAAGQ